MQKTKIMLFTLLAVLNLGAYASSNTQQFERYKPDAAMCNDSYSYVEGDKIVAETKTYAVVRQDAGTSCAAGNFYLMNKKTKTYRAVDIGTCDDRDFSVALKHGQLAFRLGKRLTALYPVYE